MTQLLESLIFFLGGLNGEQLGYGKEWNYSGELKDGLPTGKGHALIGTQYEVWAYEEATWLNGKQHGVCMCF